MFYAYYHAHFYYTIAIYLLNSKLVRTGSADAFPICEVMKKGLTICGGQTFPQEVWAAVLQEIEAGAELGFIITHYVPFSCIGEAYKMFAYQADDSLKLDIRTEYGQLLAEMES